MGSRLQRCRLGYRALIQAKKPAKASSKKESNVGVVVVDFNFLLGLFPARGSGRGLCVVVRVASQACDSGAALIERQSVP